MPAPNIYPFRSAHACGLKKIGSSYIRAVLPFRPSKLVVVDISENGLAELTRDLRSTYGMYVPEEYRTYPLSFADPVFEKIFRAEQGFDIVANFSAHKHVRSEKDNRMCDDPIVPAPPITKTRLPSISARSLSRFASMSAANMLFCRPVMWSAIN